MDASDSSDQWTNKGTTSEPQMRLILCHMSAQQHSLLYNLALVAQEQLN